jgi:Protein kinase domain
VLGTPEYMAPELIMGEPFDGRADQYALAITVYEMLCGRRPFEHETKTKVLVLHTSKAPPPLSEWCPTLPDRLSQVVLKGLAKEPEERYARCAELAKAVSAAAEGGVARDSRVRLKCSACGKTGSMPAADFAKLKESGRRATCPACKSPIDVSSAVHPAPGATPGGTMRFSFAGSSGEYASTSDQSPSTTGTTAFTSPGNSSGEPTPYREPHTERGATRALSAPAAQGAKPSQSERTPIPRRGSGTLIERSLPPSNDAAATAVFGSLKGSEPERLGTASQSISPAPVPSGARIPASTWAAVGLGVTTLLLLVAFVFSRFGPTENSNLAVGRSGRAPAIDGPEPKTASPIPGSVSGTERHEQSRADLPVGTATALARTSEPPKDPGSTSVAGQRDLSNAAHRSGGESSNSDLRSRAVDTQLVPVRKTDPTANAKNVAPAPTAFADSRYQTAMLARKPAAPEITLDKLLSAPRSYAGQIIVPAGMYNLEPPPADRTGDTRKWMATERRVGPKKGSSELEMSLAPSSFLELEPKLAARLDALETEKWKDRVALLTLWVADSGDCGLVKVEILEKASPTIRKFGYTHKGVVEYETLLVTPEGSRPARGDVDQWERVGRMNWIAQQFKKKVEVYKRMLRDNEQNMLSAQMNTMFGEMMRNAAVAEQQQRQLQQRLTAPR